MAQKAQTNSLFSRYRVTRKPSSTRGCRSRPCEALRWAGGVRIRVRVRARIAVSRFNAVLAVIGAERRINRSSPFPIDWYVRGEGALPRDWSRNLASDIRKTGRHRISHHRDVVLIGHKWMLAFWKRIFAPVLGIPLAFKLALNQIKSPAEIGGVCRLCHAAVRS